MQHGMLSPSHHLEIFWRVIKRVAIYVMDDIIFGEQTAKGLFGDYSMDIDVTVYPRAGMVPTQHNQVLFASHTHF